MPGIDRRIEQRHQLDLALDVLAVADLGQPVLDRVPVAESSFAFGGTQKYSDLPDAEQRAGVAVGARRRRRW